MDSNIGLFSLFLKLVVLESSNAFDRFMDSLVMRWLSELWCERIQGYRVMWTEDEIILYRKTGDGSRYPEEDATQRG